jgi:ArsR family transcriptional regulator
MAKEKKVKLKKAVKMVSALAQETRMSVFRLLMLRRSEGGLPAGVIAEMLDVPSATMSFHLNQLTNAGLLKSVKDGRQVIYSVKKKSVKGLVRFIQEGADDRDEEEETLLPEQEDDACSGDGEPVALPLARKLRAAS